MADSPLTVFATSDEPVLLAALRGELAADGVPANLGVDIAGEATHEQLRDPAWEAAILRWTEPELHEVVLIERLTRGDEEAERLIRMHQARIEADDDVAGRMIIADYLARTKTVYTVQLLPALLTADGHEAWGALDELLRYIARTADGLIYVEAEGYCDADGELLLAEAGEPADTDVPELD